MARVFREYERRKSGRGLIDFEDLLELACTCYEGGEWAVGAFRERYRAFTVDEYQDVNLLQQTLLELWLGDRDDLCAVGDDYQSIYGVHRRDAALAARSAGALPACDGRPARGELPLDAAGARAREPARAAARRCREDAAGDARRRARARVTPFASREERRVRRRAGARAAAAGVPSRRWRCSAA